MPRTNTYGFPSAVGIGSPAAAGFRKSRRDQLTCSLSPWRAAPQGRRGASSSLSSGECGCPDALPDCVVDGATLDEGEGESARADKFDVYKLDPDT